MFEDGMIISVADRTEMHDCLTPVAKSRVSVGKWYASIKLESETEWWYLSSLLFAAGFKI